MKRMIPHIWKVLHVPRRVGVKQKVIQSGMLHKVELEGQRRNEMVINVVKNASDCRINIFFENRNDCPILTVKLQFGNLATEEERIFERVKTCCGIYLVAEVERKSEASLMRKFSEQSQASNDVTNPSVGSLGSSFLTHLIMNVVETDIAIII